MASEVTDVSGLPAAAAAAGRPEGESLAERYAAIAHAYEPRPVDRVLRAADLLIAGAVLLVTSPLLLVFTIAIRVTSGRPVLYRGARVGQAGRIYQMYKFRTLTPDAESRLSPFYGPELSVKTREEETRLGRVMRVTQLDELPQLFNVLKGDMSIVGPRPIRPVFFERLCEQIPAYWQRLVLRPGLTGFAQVRMGREETWAEKLAHDLEYIADRSVSLYLRICFRTTMRVIKRVFVDSVGLVAGRRSA
ncbi:MAG TPA: sugar transferase [Thermoleophilaceae bacterium]|jgi:lipopolysaccharide/colanic/teichoic acid biosynthesis glycosyltransferase|nr:sugar transferase [Thermoleophilaceae bacterium]